MLSDVFVYHQEFKQNIDAVKSTAAGTTDILSACILRNVRARDEAVAALVATGSSPSVLLQPSLEDADPVVPLVATGTSPSELLRSVLQILEQGKNAFWPMFLLTSNPVLDLISGDDKVLLFD